MSIKIKWKLFRKKYIAPIKLAYMFVIYGFAIAYFKKFFVLLKKRYIDHNTQVNKWVKPEQNGLNRQNNQLDAGINIIGFVRNVFGLSQMATSIGESLCAINVPMLYVDCSNLSRSKVVYNEIIEKKIKEKNKYNCNILCVTGKEVLSFVFDKKVEFFKNRYNIHYGAWELQAYPQHWSGYFNNVVIDEFWAMSTFLQQSAQQTLRTPVLCLPFAVDFELPSNSLNRAYFNLPKDQFLYFFSFDMSSYVARKNPEAVLQAFSIAFPKNPDVGLVIKVSYDKSNLKQAKSMADLMVAADRDYKNRIYIKSDVITNTEMKGLINTCDVYVSLHRAEGFGIGMAEAMKMKKAVIATNYSGNTDFTTQATACMVDYTLIKIKPGEYANSYPNDVWAEASVHHAAEHMQKLFTNPSCYNAIATAGKNFIDAEYNYEVTGNRFLHRLKEVGVL